MQCVRLLEMQFTCRGTLTFLPLLLIILHLNPSMVQGNVESNQHSKRVIDEVRNIHSCKVQIYNCTEGKDWMVRDHKFDSIRKRKNIEGKMIHGEEKTWDADVVSTEDLDQCVEECLSVPGCKAVNLFEEKKECTLLNYGVKDGQVSPEAAIETQMGVIHAFPKCDFHTTLDTPGVPSDKYTYQSNSRGKSGTAHWWPWVVDLAIHTGNGKPLKFCTGVLVPTNVSKTSTDIVVTTASCLLKDRERIMRGYKGTKDVHDQRSEQDKGKRPTLDLILSDYSFWVTAGKQDTFNFEDGEQHQRSRLIYINADFKVDIDSDYKIVTDPGSEEEPWNDVALIKLDSPFQYSDTVRSIHPPTSVQPKRLGMCKGGCKKFKNTEKHCVVAGWCHSKDLKGNPISNFLQYQVSVDKARYCEKIWKSGQWTGVRMSRKIKEKVGSLFKKSNIYCVTQVNRKEPSCEGEEGSMMACRSAGETKWTLEGLATSIRRDGGVRIFTPLSHQSEWITQKAYHLTSLKISYRQTVIRV